MALCTQNEYTVFNAEDTIMATETTSLPVYKRVAAALRAKLEGEYRVGDILLSEVQLAKDFDINRRTIRQAIGVLTYEGRIRKHSGRGSVVVDRTATGEFAIVIRPALFSSGSHAYYNLMGRLIVDLLHARNRQWSVKVHLGAQTETGHQFPATLDLCEPDVLKRLRGVFTFHELYDIGSELKAAQVPVVSLTDTPLEPGSVTFDFRSLYTKGVAHLKAAGCRTVGMLWGSANRRDWFVQAAKACALETRPEWMSQLTVDEYTEQHGYEWMTQFWKNPSHPDGILVEDDILCCGALRAALLLGVEFPRDLKLVTHANRGIPLSYHKPVTRVEFDPFVRAGKAVDMMLTLVEGRTPSAECVHLPGELMKGATT